MYRQQKLVCNCHTCFATRQRISTPIEYKSVTNSNDSITDHDLRTRLTDKDSVGVLFNVVPGFIQHQRPFGQLLRQLLLRRPSFPWPRLFFSSFTSSFGGATTASS